MVVSTALQYYYRVWLHTSVAAGAASLLLKLWKNKLTPAVAAAGVTGVFVHAMSVTRLPAWSFNFGASHVWKEIPLSSPFFEGTAKAPLAMLQWVNSGDPKGWTDFVGFVVC